MREPNRSHPDYDQLIGSSELGGCIKANAALLQDFAPLPTPEKMEEAFARGHDHEDRCLAAMTEDGWDIRDQQSEYVIPCGPRIGVIVHPDAIGSRSGYMDDKVIEVKSLATWNNFEKAYKTQTFTDPYMHRIAWQVSCQMIATELEALVVCHDDRGVTHFLVIEVPPFTLEEIEQRVGEILDSASGELPVLCSQNDWPCPVAYLHEDPEYDDDPELDGLVAEYLAAGELMKRTKSLQDEWKKKIEAALGDRDSVSTAASKVTRYEQKGATKWIDDKVIERLVDDGMDPDDYRTTGKASQRLKITGRDGE